MVRRRHTRTRTHINRTREQIKQRKPSLYKVHKQNGFFFFLRIKCSHSIRCWPLKSHYFSTSKQFCLLLDRGLCCLVPDGGAVVVRISIAQKQNKNLNTEIVLEKRIKKKHTKIPIEIYSISKQRHQEPNQTKNELHGEKVHKKAKLHNPLYSWFECFFSLSSFWLCFLCDLFNFFWVGFVALWFDKMCNIVWPFWKLYNDRWWIICRLLPGIRWLTTWNIETCPYLNIWTWKTMFATVTLIVLEMWIYFEDQMQQQRHDAYKPFYPNFYFTF